MLHVFLQYAESFSILFWHFPAAFCFWQVFLAHQTGGWTSAHSRAGLGDVVVVVVAGGVQLLQVFLQYFESFAFRFAHFPLFFCFLQELLLHHIGGWRSTHSDLRVKAATAAEGAADWTALVTEFAKTLEVIVSLTSWAFSSGTIASILNFCEPASRSLRIRLLVQMPLPSVATVTFSVEVWSSDAVVSRRALCTAPHSDVWMFDTVVEVLTVVSTTVGTSVGLGLGTLVGLGLGTLVGLGDAAFFE